jgi:TonB family protein
MLLGVIRSGVWKHVACTRSKPLWFHPLSSTSVDWLLPFLRVRKRRCSMNRNPSWAALSLSMLLALPAFAQSSSVAAGATTSGAGLRSLAVSKIRPIYPHDALKESITGVAVAQIHLTVEGRVETVNILQAPSPSIGQAVKSAVIQWRFQPNNGSNGEPPLLVSGKLVFYFEIRGGKGVVLFPEETGYVGR